MPLPIKTFVRASRAPYGYYIAKSAIGLRLADGKPIHLFGFAFGREEAEVAQRSVYELKERFYACYDVWKGASDKGEVLDMHHWLTHEKTGECPAHNLLFHHVTAGSSPLLDSNGMAWYSNLKGALNHAIMESFERHMLSLVWYYGAPLYLISSEKLDGEYKVCTYSTLNEIPFALTVVEQEVEGIWLCGSSVAHCMDVSIEKSKREAFMLLDGILFGEDGKLNPSHSGKRLASLSQEKVSMFRSLHFSKLIVGRRYSSQKSSDFMRWFDCTGIDAYKLRYCALKNDAEGALVRVIHPNLLNPKSLRGICGDEIPDDPFC
ncbi:MAG: YcaO-like family protein [Pseudomonadota bacterium]|nr:YcaO-like family protein [Pseudomonadota bacterium]